MVRPVLDYARADPGRSVLVRPHPLLPAGIADDHGPDADAYRQLVELPNVMVSSGPILDDIAASAALLTDGIAIIAYFSATGRPMAVTRDAESPDFNEIGTLLCENAKTIDSPEAARAWLDAVAGEPSNPRRIEVLDQVFPDSDESPTARWLALTGDRARRR